MNTIPYIRDAEKVRAACKEGDDGSIIALKPSKIVVPERFIEKQLLVIGADTYVIGCFAHVVEDKYYAVFLGVAMFHTEPTTIATVKYNNDTYVEMSYDKGARILVSQEVVQDNILAYRLNDEMVAKGHVPWYLGYDDRLKLLFTSNRLAGMDLLSNHTMLELTAAAISRNPANINEYYRHMVTSYDDLLKMPPLAIPLMSVSYGTTNTVSKIMGSYFQQGLDSALVNPSTHVENIEQLLRA